MLELDKYLSDTRARESDSKEPEKDPRNPFENDYARIITSSSFRRLQDKTQVFPLKRQDFVRTRLTHSLEVSTFGRSIGISVEKALFDKKLLSEKKKGHLPSLLASAGLIHDIGNPPFGHFGETAIKNFFQKLFEEEQYRDHLLGDASSRIDGLSDQEKTDYQNFDGNVQTLRLLTRLQYLKDEHGMNLSLATLATIMKYPFNSLEGNKGDAKKGNHELSKKKFGYFISEKPLFDSIKKEFESRKRYPFTFLLEAADDIAYSVADIEDACKKCIITEKEIDDLLEPIYDVDYFKSGLIKKYPEYLKRVDPDYKDKHKNELAVQQFRIDVQGVMIKAVVQEFVDNIEAIKSGEYDKDLLENSSAKNLRGVFKEIAKKIYKSKDILKNELVGYRVIQSLLEEFVPATLFMDDDTKEKHKRVFGLISNNYNFIYKQFSPKDDYSKIQLAVDYICGMTDSFALKLYHDLRGHG